MNKDDYALFKYSIIAPFINQTSGTNSIRSFSNSAACKEYFFEGKYLRFKPETIRKWIKLYKDNGFDNLKRKTRNDNKKPRSFDEDVLLRIDDLKTEFPKLRATSLHEKLVEEGYILKDDVSVRTFQRFVANKNYLNLNTDHERRSYSFEFPNDSWQSDTTHGPYLIVKGQKYKTYIIVFIDDHSRLIVGARAFLHDNAINMQCLFKESIRLFGIPKQLYVDNGGPYSNKQLRIICARLGINLKNAKIFDPESKGKIERFNRTLKDEWMNTFDWNKIKDLDDLNNRLNDYITKYNSSIHKSIKMSPNDSYFNGSVNTDIKYIDGDLLDKSFYHTVSRKVSNTGTITIENRTYEIDYSFARKTLDFTYNPHDLSKVYLDDKEYTLLDSVANSRRKRKKNADYSKIANKENEEIKEYEDEWVFWF